MTYKESRHAPEWELSLLKMWEIAEVDSENVPIIMWCVLSLDMERAG